MSFYYLPDLDLILDTVLQLLPLLGWRHADEHLFLHLPTLDLSLNLIAPSESSQRADLSMTLVVK